MPHFQVANTIFQIPGHLNRWLFSYLLTAVKKPFYLTILNSSYTTGSYTTGYKGPILPAYRTGRLLVKPAYLPLNNLRPILATTKFITFAP